MMTTSTARAPQRRPTARALRALAPRPVGWHTTDADEIALRRQRAVGERSRIENLDPGEPLFSTFAVHSPSGGQYAVEIRSLTEPENSCSCPDFRTNGLGTCKHVEAVLANLSKRVGRRTLKGSKRSPRAEVFLRRLGEPEVALAVPHAPLPQETREVLGRFFDDSGPLRGDPAEAVPSLVRALESCSGTRVSREVVEWAADRARRATRAGERQVLEDEIRSGRRALELLRLPLYPYQVEGMLHLVCTERALLGDEMGLGKTAQAVAACVLLKELRGIERVLVICPVSLKAEWQDQITKFTPLPLQLVQGTKPSRLASYDAPAFFTVVNYEQAVRDVTEINTRLRPEVIILDEAQRIKNWNTKTARVLKRLQSRYAFLLTGTPIENRIDEIYSITEFLDPLVFGPLFRFNREFYELDDRGRPVGYRNLSELQRRIRPLLLRRRKDQIAEQLPARIDNNYFVPMSAAQIELYGEYQDRVARLLGTAARRPLTREEHEKLQRWLACMRMLCDTPYILSPRNRECPKIHELEAVLEDLDVRRTRKAIIFSEWERMLELVRHLAQEMHLAYAWHTGSVPQARRRDEIHRFKTDSTCRLFLSTDAGGLGLNLQVASVVINLDLPWNPARLEQRIARAWRKHQRAQVHVVNLISEGTIEHQMLGRLAAKQQLADALLDARGDVTQVRMPSAARQGFLDQLRVLLKTDVLPAAGRMPAVPAAPPTPLERLRARVGAGLAARIVDLQVLATEPDRAPLALVVIDRADAATAGGLSAHWPRVASDADLPAEMEVIEAAGWETLQRLAQRGFVPALAALVQPGAGNDREAEARRRERARQLMEGATRKLKMAEVLRSGGFAVEAVAPAREARELAVRAVAIASALLTVEEDGPVPESILGDELLSRTPMRKEDIAVVVRLRGQDNGAATNDTPAAGTFIDESTTLVHRLAGQL